MCPFRADQTYDGRTYANPDEMLKIAGDMVVTGTEARALV